MDNHAILRGRWIRERLLGGGIPDVPITVDAMLPDEPKKTSRAHAGDSRDLLRTHEKWTLSGFRSRCSIMQAYIAPLN